MEDQGGGNSSPGRGKNFHYSMSSRLTLGPTQPPMQRVPMAFSTRVKRPGREAHLQLMPRSRKYGSIHPLPHTSSWRSDYFLKHRDDFTSYSLGMIPFALFKFGINIWNSESFKYIGRTPPTGDRPIESLTIQGYIDTYIYDLSWIRSPRPCVHCDHSIPAL
jgi:hypothetical protein